MQTRWRILPRRTEPIGGEKKGAASGEAFSRRLGFNQRGEHKHQPDKGNVISSPVGADQASAPAAPARDHLAAARAAQATRASILSKAN
jgi:hypothetical protein